MTKYATAIIVQRPHRSTQNLSRKNMFDINTGGFQYITLTHYVIVIWS
jgi:hypothetical protein